MYQSGPENAPRVLNHIFLCVQVLATIVWNPAETDKLICLSADTDKLICLGAIIFAPKVILGRLNKDVRAWFGVC